MTSQFVLIDHDACPVLKFSSRSARNAALKAATRDEKNIMLIDVAKGKLHIFEGWREQLNPDLMNEYEKQRGVLT